MVDFRKLGDAARQRSGRLAGAASTRAQADYGRARAYLMRQPPFKRAELVALWGVAGMLGVLLLWVLILIPVTPGIGDLTKARAALAT